MKAPCATASTQTPPSSSEPSATPTAAEPTSSSEQPLPISFGEDLYYQLGGWLDDDNAVTTPLENELHARG